MPTATYSTLIHADFDDIWGMLLDKVQQPQKWMPGVERVELSEVGASNPSSNSEKWERCVWFQDGSLVRERITIDEANRAIVVEPLNDQRYTGYVSTVLLRCPVAGHALGAHVLVRTLDFRAKRRLTDEEIAQGEVMASKVKESILALKYEAESHEEGGG
ncbi:hypothetical protein CDCA_CDCA03G1138 [Cyanidium caldarium]|uniref:Polyketide cyclase / dehydrase and lipid transport n=1 Tax=Cyanidium caldarium TaxID=2771 RepID=A0AAV9ITC1_CYACA|nr:hypothetical protein CDCA_CDCA03G1138 [Cyanidium caldarium]